MMWVAPTSGHAAASLVSLDVGHLNGDTLMVLGKGATDREHDIWAEDLRQAFLYRVAADQRGDVGISKTILEGLGRSETEPG